MPRIRTHPGEILREEYLEPLALSARALASEIGVPANRVSEIVACRRGITADTAMRLARYFQTTPEFWMNMQAGYDLSKAQAETDYSSISRSRRAGCILMPGWSGGSGTENQRD